MCNFINSPSAECLDEWIWDDLPPRRPAVYLNALNIEVCEAHRAECNKPALDIYPAGISPDGDTIGYLSKLFRFPTLDELLNKQRTVAWHSINELNRWNPSQTQYLPVPTEDVLPLGQIQFGPRMLPAPRDTPGYLHRRYVRSRLAQN